MDQGVEWIVISTCGRAILRWLAAVDRVGQPSVPPDWIWHYDGGSFSIADIAKAGPVRAIREHPPVCAIPIGVFSGT